jgi:Cof subfamily protein (haloacid dehalogenase superfamily)
VKRLYVSDLDGTLLDELWRISPPNLAKLNQALADGLLFSVASGRSLSSMQRALAGMNLSLPVVECNGAFLTDWHTGEHLAVNDMPSDIGAGIYEQAVGLGLDPFVVTFDGERDWLSYGELENAGTKWYYQKRKQHEDPRLRHQSKMDLVFQEKVVAFILMGATADLAKLQASIQQNWGNEIVTHFYIEPHSPEWSWLDVHDVSANKGTTIQLMQKKLDLQVEELVVFGDEVNDLGMFALADRAYAPDNAVEPVKSKATAVLPHCQQGSVAQFVLQEWQ